VLDYAPRFAEGAMQLVQWLLQGKLKHDETIVDGLENAPMALNRLFDGNKLGKLMLKVADPA
jgi:NADPH-dependent curcumin reductase CurA